ncbi:Metallophosphoesterase [Penicillium digitatum]|uniref:Metallophosphoesterase n=1 Tax=Penicillium digitatum TaxID=36651 RepID=A0A7T6XSM2_PENDI|nr:Metallophosphoesterase [Penicillium digitatum]
MSIRRPSAHQRRARHEKLRFTEKGTFQISVFGDLHFAEDDEADKNSTRVMNSVLSSEEVQLVVLNGDLISGEATQGSTNPSLYVDRIVAPLVDRGLPWASTYGNHDSEINLDPEEIFRQETKYQNSLTQRRVWGSTAGITNYYLPIFSHEASEDSTPVFILWFFDSQGGHFALTENEERKSVPRQNWVDDAVVEWFLEANSNLSFTYGQTIPSLAFVHIPVHPMRAFQESGVSPTREPGINGERVQEQGYDADAGYQSQDFPLISALLNTTGLAATFSGHDHDNDWCFKWDSKLPGLNVTGNGMNMCYGRHTGYGGYGEWARGGRQILLDQRSLGDDVRTWIRMENGLISGDVHLNATYGQDRYGLSEKRLIEQHSGGLSPSPQYLGVIYLWMFLFSGLISRV